jgi:hypothetical protein
VSAEDAEAEVAAALEDVEQAERELALGIADVGIPGLHKLRDRARHARLRAAGEEEKARQARAAERLRDLRQLGTEIDKAAAGETIAELTSALTSIADLSARVYALAATHDLMVAELIAAARELNVEDRTPSGPRESSGFICVDQGGIIHGTTVIRPVRGTILDTLGIALRGRGDDAVTALRATGSLAPPLRPKYLLRGRNGSLHAMDTLNEPMADRIRNGDLERLSEAEIDLWMKGELG